MLFVVCPLNGFSIGAAVLAQLTRVPNTQCGNYQGELGGGSTSLVHVFNPPYFVIFVDLGGSVPPITA